MVCAAAVRAPGARLQRAVEEPVSFKFDRRRARREAATCWMPATFADGAGRLGVTSVEVLDAGPRGMGVRSASALEPGTLLSLHSPGARFPVVTATVVRCERGEQGYVIGLATRPDRAA